MSIFWRVLIGAMKKSGMEVLCLAPAGDEASDRALEEMGARLIHYRLDRKGLNPARDLATLLNLKAVLGAEKPDLVFATTIKPVIYGCIASHMAGVPAIFATITGLGYAFEADTPLKKIINRISRSLYKNSLKYADGIFFQNPDDRDLFISQGILEKNANVLFAAGTGVDINHFALSPFPSLPPAGPVVFLMLARLLEAKGIREYREAAEILKKKYPLARFQLLGPRERGRGAITEREISSWAGGPLEYLGEARDVRPHIAASHVAVLPSWREGAPTALMEAMSMGRPCVATDAPGCREMIVNGRNGWLVPIKNPEALAGAMERFLLDPSLIMSMGARSRELAEEKYEAGGVAMRILDDMRAASSLKWPQSGEKQ